MAKMDIAEKRRHQDGRLPRPSSEHEYRSLPRVVDGGVVLAQRLVRKVCANCAEDEPLGTHTRWRVGYAMKDYRDLKFKVGRGCTECNFLGYRGRIAVFELLTLNDQEKDAVLSRKSS